MTLTVYGIPNCDTVKKARVWLGDKGQDFAFHDFRKDGLSAEMVTRWLAQVPMDKLLNKRGTSWRKLSDADKVNEEAAHLVALLDAAPPPVWTALTAPAPAASAMLHLQVTCDPAGLVGERPWFLYESYASHMGGGHSDIQARLWAEDGTLCGVATQHIVDFTSSTSK